jgi:hypothetical protein
VQQNHNGQAQPHADPDGFTRSVDAHRSPPAQRSIDRYTGGAAGRCTRRSRPGRELGKDSETGQAVAGHRDCEDVAEIVLAGHDEALGCAIARFVWVAGVTGSVRDATDMTGLWCAGDASGSA